jgi:hypothetical protein
VHREIVLPDTSERVWELLVDWERQASWMPDVDDVAVLTPMRDGMGVRLAARTRVFGIPAFTDMLEVTRWEPPTCLRVEHRRLVHGSGVWLLEPTPEGTRFEWTEEVSLPVPLVGELMLAWYRPVQRWLMGRSMRAFRAYVVAAGPRPSDEG